MKQILPLLLACLFAGCSFQHVGSKIALPGVTFDLPKNSRFTSLHAQVPILTSNGVVMASLVISNGVFETDPAVINAAAAHDALLISTTGDTILKVIEGASAAAGKGAKP